MPVHDWTRVDAGVFHDFHNSWIFTLKAALNQGVLPSGYYALTDRQMNEFKPDVLTLHRSGNGNGRPADPPAGPGVVAVADAPPRAARHLTTGPLPKSVVVRAVDGGRVVALIEVVSASNKDRPQHVANFVQKAQAALRGGVNVAVLDILPPNKHDPAGMSAAVWEAVGGDGYDLPAGQPLTVASFAVDGRVELYADHLAVGDRLPDLALFLDPDYYIRLPLEASYSAAFASIPEYYRALLSAPSPAG